MPWKVHWIWNCCLTINWMLKIKTVLILRAKLFSQSKLLAVTVLLLCILLCIQISHQWEHESLGTAVRIRDLNTAQQIHLPTISLVAQRWAFQVHLKLWKVLWKVLWLEMKNASSETIGVRSYFRRKRGKNIFLKVVTHCHRLTAAPNLAKTAWRTWLSPGLHYGLN